MSSPTIVITTKNKKAEGGSYDFSWFTYYLLTISKFSFPHACHLCVYPFCPKHQAPGQHQPLACCFSISMVPRGSFAYLTAFVASLYSLFTYVDMMGTQTPKEFVYSSSHIQGNRRDEHQACLIDTIKRGHQEASSVPLRRIIICHGSRHRSGARGAETYSFWTYMETWTDAPAQKRTFFRHHMRHSLN